MSSNKVSYYLFECRNYRPNDAIKIVHRACYTGDLKDVKKMFSWLENNNKTRNIYREIILKIIETHKKINYSIESFNKDTNCKFEEEFKKENRNDYCNNENCFMCIDIPCYSIVRCDSIDLKSMENNEENKDINFYAIVNEIPNIIKNMIETEI